MRRPIRSHVANRRMFQGGGLSPFPRPTGILASSQPLVDQVAQNAVNPNRTMPMNQGGAARFNNGGTSYFPGQRIQDVTIDTAKDLAERGSNVLERIGLAGQEAWSYVPPILGGKAFTPKHDTLVSSGRVVPGTEGPLVADIGVTDVTTYGDPLGVTKDFNWVVDNPQAGTVTIKDFDFSSLTGKIMRAQEWFNETPWMTGRRIFPKFSVRGIEKLDGQGGLQSAVFNMTWHLPQYEKEIKQIATQIIEQNPDIKPEDLKNQIAVTLKTNVEGQNPGIIKIKQEGAANLHEATVPDDTDQKVMTLAESIDASKTPSADIDKMLGQPEIGPDINLLEKMEYDRQIAALIPYWEERDFDSGFIDTLRDKGVSNEVLAGLVNQRIELVAERDRREKAVTETGGYGVGPGDDVRKAKGKDYGSFAEEAGQGPVDEKVDIDVQEGDGNDGKDTSQDQIEGGGSDAPIVDLGEVKERRATSNMEYEAALQDQIIDAATTNDTEKTTKTIEDYKKEFIEAMPEYEGMSKDEKAYSWIKMGMAIAAGQSPNAIENISKGVLATIDEFADDPKKKREYEMQVALSAGKYAVESVNALRTQERALESEFENYVVKEDGTITFPDGTEKKVTEGQVIPISVADKAAGMNFDNLITTGMYGDELAATKALNKLQNDLNKTLRAELVVSDDMTMKVTKEYNEALDKVIMGNELTSFIDSAMELNAKGQVTGIKSLFKDTVLKVFNAAGVSTKVIGMSEEDAVEALGGRQSYNDKMQVVANNMLKTLLGEGSKNISNVDRQLAQEISGLVKSLQAGAFQNPTLLNDKLQRIRSRIDKNIEQGEATINQLNTTFAHRLVPGTDEKFTEFVLQPLAKKATTPKGTPYRDLGTDVGVLGEFITNDDGTFTYKMFEATS